MNHEKTLTCSRDEWKRGLRDEIFVFLRIFPLKFPQILFENLETTNVNFPLEMFDCLEND